MDAQRLLSELQQQQLELQKKQESLMYVILKPLDHHNVMPSSFHYRQATNSFTDIDKERVEIRQQLEVCTLLYGVECYFQLAVYLGATEGHH